MNVSWADRWGTGLPIAHLFQKTPLRDNVAFVLVAILGMDA